MRPPECFGGQSGSWLTVAGMHSAAVRLNTLVQVVTMAVVAAMGLKQPTHPLCWCRKRSCNQRSVGAQFGQHETKSYEVGHKFLSNTWTSDDPALLHTIELNLASLDLSYGSNHIVEESAPLLPNGLILNPICFDHYLQDIPLWGVAVAYRQTRPWCCIPSVCAVRMRIRHLGACGV